MRVRFAHPPRETNPATGFHRRTDTYYQLLEELHLLKRRVVVAKAERLGDVAESQLAFDKLLAETQAIEKVLDAAGAVEVDSKKE